MTTSEHRPTGGLRAFIAVNIADDLRRGLAAVQERLRACGADVKWVRPEGIHVTLKFLGWVKQERLPQVEQALAQALAGAAPFRLALEGVGGFPSAARPRVIWVGVKEGARELADLARRVEQALEALGFEPEGREFSAHVTLGRCRSVAGRDALAAVMRQEQTRPLGQMEVTCVELMRSDLRPTGAIYTSQRAFALSGPREGKGNDHGGQG